MSRPKAHKLGVGGGGPVNLPANIFGERFHGPLVHEVTRAELAAQRQGSAATKTRGLVRGGGAKPWRQKGTGRARIGSIRAPHWTGGGTAFGPSPRHYTVKVNRKARRRALRAALTLHVERDTLAVIDGAQFKQPSTRQAAELLDKWGAPRPTLVVLADSELDCARSFRNLRDAEVISVHDIAVSEIVCAASLIVSEDALDLLAQLAAAIVTGASVAKAGAAEAEDGKAGVA